MLTIKITTVGLSNVGRLLAYNGRRNCYSSIE